MRRVPNRANTRCQLTSWSRGAGIKGTDTPRRVPHRTSHDGAYSGAVWAAERDTKRPTLRPEPRSGSLLPLSVSTLYSRVGKKNVI